MVINLKKTSIWLDNLNYTPNEELKNNIEVDVLIIGGGMTGISTAYHLKNSNLKVCLVEKNIIGHGVTARTTGKLTYLQELIYTDLVKEYNKEKAKLYFNSQLEAIKTVENIINKHNIKCNYEKVSSYIFTLNKSKVKKIKCEKVLLEEFNVNINEHTTLPDKTKVTYAIETKDTAVFHPLKYLIDLKNICEKKGILIYENTKILQISKEDVFICKTKDNIIRAKKVVLALHYPYFLFPFLMPFKTHLEKSYIVATQDNNKFFSAITSEKPTISIRYTNNNAKDYKIILTNSHNIAFKNNDSKNYNELLNNIDKKPCYIWSNKDIITNDKLPYIGELKEGLYIGTGYNTWGMTNGSIAGKILSDLILNKENIYQELFNPQRHLPVNSFLNFPIDVVSNIKSFVGSKINKNKAWYNKNVKFEKRNGENIAIFKDENNEEHIVYNRCPHLKCGLIFNQEEKTWDCPCHGSRFDLDGKCIEGPSNYDISYKK